MQMQTAKNKAVSDLPGPMHRRYSSGCPQHWNSARLGLE